MDLTSPRKTAINLKHHHSGLENYSPPIFPNQLLPFFLATMFLTLNEVVDCAPIGKKSIQKRPLLFSKLFTPQVKDCPKPCHCPSFVLIDVGWLVLIDKRRSKL